jgi:hypothetical protein
VRLLIVLASSSANERPGKVEDRVVVRIATQALPGIWGFCSGDVPQALADLEGTGVVALYRVTSDPSSTIDVTVYDSSDETNPATIAPGGHAELGVKSPFENAYS